MSKPPGIYWRSLATMLGAFICGTLLAFGHDQFYHRLSNEAAPVDKYVFGRLAFSKQQTNLNIGAALAFLVKVCLVLAASVAYAQVFWKTADQMSSKVGVLLGKADSMHLASQNLLDFLTPSTWRSAPWLLLVALTIWLIPIAAVVTPGTLSVRISNTRTLNVTKLDVPSLDFRSLKFARKLTIPEGYQPSPMFSTYDYTGPHRRVLQTAYMVATGGTILPIAPPAPNSSWIDTFHGPSLTCTRIQGEDRDTILMNIAEYITSDCNNAATYLSWIRQRRGDGIDVPYKTSTSMASTLQPFDSGSTSYSSNSRLDEGAMMASLYVALLPGMHDPYTMGRTPGLAVCHLGHDILLSPESPLDSIGRNATLIQCDLVNSTYTTSFSFVDGEQNLDVKVVKSDTGVEIVNAVGWGHDPKNCLQAVDDPMLEVDCKFDHSVLWRLSYQSVMGAFSSMLKGQATRNADFVTSNVNTSVTLTSLADSDEVRFLNDDYLRDGLDMNWNLQDFIAQVNSPESRGVSYSNEADLTNESTSRNQPPLDKALEDLLQNVTISLMRFPDLWADKASITAPPPVMVTFPISVPTYTYALEKLWLTYGIAILLSAASATFGTAVMLIRGKSYDCNFSTILRTTRHAELDQEIAASDTDGNAPLPQHLAEARIRFSRSRYLSSGHDGSSLELNVLPSQEPLILQPATPVMEAPEQSMDQLHRPWSLHRPSTGDDTSENELELPPESACASSIARPAEGAHNVDVERRLLV